MIHKTPALMITAFQLIFSPFETWQKITTAQRGFFWVLCLYLVPLMVIALGLEGYMLTQWGQKRGDLGLVVKVPTDLAIRYTVAYAVFLLAGAIVGAKFLALASESFNVHTTYFQSFMVVAYAFGPIILVRMLDGVPQLNTWVCWAIGVALSTSVLYHGVGMVLRPDQTKGFGLYLISIIIVVLVTALAHFAALAVLEGKVLRPKTAQIHDVTFAAVASVAQGEGGPQIFD